MMTEDELDKAESYWTSQEKDAKKMPAEVLREKAEAFLTSRNTCALACGAGDFVRCTPLEYVWRDGAIWIFTEGGLKLHALRKNLRVSLAAFEPYAGFGQACEHPGHRHGRNRGPRECRVCGSCHSEGHAPGDARACADPSPSPENRALPYGPSHEQLA